MSEDEDEDDDIYEIEQNLIWIGFSTTASRDTL